MKILFAVFLVGYILMVEARSGGKDVSPNIDRSVRSPIHAVGGRVGAGNDRRKRDTYPYHHHDYDQSQTQTKRELHIPLTKSEEIPENPQNGNQQQKREFRIPIAKLSQGEHTPAKNVEIKEEKRESDEQKSPAQGEQDSGVHELYLRISKRFMDNNKGGNERQGKKREAKDEQGQEKGFHELFIRVNRDIEHVQH